MSSFCRKDVLIKGNEPMKKTGKYKWLSVFLVVIFLFSVTGCGKTQPADSGSADEALSRHAELIDARQFKRTFYFRADMEDHSVRSESTEEDRTALLARNIDGKANVFYYLDVTGEVDLEDLEKEDFLRDFRKRLNEESDDYQYTKVELIDHGANYYEYRAKIRNKSVEEELSAETETADSSAEVEKRPMLFMFVKKGKRTYELIGLDMEAEDATAFSESFQGILDEIAPITQKSSKEKSEEKEAS